MNNRNSLAAAAALLACCLWSAANNLQAAGGVAQQESCDAGVGLGCGSADKPKGAQDPGKKPEPEYKGPGIGEGITADSIGSNGNARGRSGTYLATPGVLDELQARLEHCARGTQDSIERGRGNRTRSSHPELEVSKCIDLDPKQEGYGGFINDCDHEIIFTFCAFRPKKDAWTEAFNCETTRGGTETIGPKTTLAAHTKGAEMIYWAACKFPEGLVSDVVFTEGKGLQFRCFAWDNEESYSMNEQMMSIQKCSATELQQPLQERLANEERQKAAEEAKQQRIAQQRAARARQETVAVDAPADNRVSPAPTRSRVNKSARWSSVCERNGTKVFDVVAATGAKYGMIKTDIIYRDLREWDLKIIKPCLEYDETMRPYFDRISEEVRHVNRLCAGAHGQFECMRWGGWPDMAKDYYAKYEAEAQKALTDPDYSADLGPVRYGPGSGGDAPSDPQSQQCKLGLDRLESEYEAINRRKPSTASLIDELQVAIYMTSRTKSHLAANCKGTREYKDLASYQQAYDQAMSACRGSVSNTSVCVAKVPW